MNNENLESVLSHCLQVQHAKTKQIIVDTLKQTAIDLRSLNYEAESRAVQCVSNWLNNIKLEDCQDEQKNSK